MCSSVTTPSSRFGGTLRNDSRSRTPIPCVRQDRSRCFGLPAVRYRSSPRQRGTGSVHGAASGYPIAASASTFATYVLTGLILEHQSDVATEIARVADLVRGLANHPKPAAWVNALSEVARIVFRAAVRLSTPASVEAVAGRPRAIDVGRVRWCSLTDRPVIWVPLFAENADMVGAPDQAWTLDPLGPSTIWHSQAPSVQLDPDWYARIVLYPEDIRLWCITPEGQSWVLPLTLLDLLGHRTQHLGPWLRALEDLDHSQSSGPEDRLTIPESPRANRLPPEDAAPAASGANASHGTGDGDRYSRDWILERVARYSYEADDRPQAAGRAASAAGYYSRAGFLEVVRWKSARSLGLAERNSSSIIKRTTRRALDPPT